MIVVGFSSSEVKFLTPNIAVGDALLRSFLMTLISLVELTPANYHSISVNDNFNSSFVGIRDIPGRVKARSKSEFNFQELRTPLC